MTKGEIMKIQELFVLANEELAKVIDQISDDQFDIEMPEGTTLQPATLGESVRNHTFDDAWVPEILEGKTGDQVGAKYDFLKTDGDIKSNYKEYNQRANAAVKGFDDLEKICHFSYGDFSAKECLQHLTSYRGFRVFTIAKIIGADTKMNPELVQAMFDEYTPLIEQYRQWGVFGPAVEVAKDASPQEKLLAMAGFES